MTGVITRNDLRGLVARLAHPIDSQRMAENRALRMIVRLGLHEPIGLGEAIRLVTIELRCGQVLEIKTTARALHAFLQTAPTPIAGPQASMPIA